MRSLGITEGLNVSRLMKSNYDSRIGFNVGGKWEYDVVSWFYYEEICCCREKVL